MWLEDVLHVITHLTSIKALLQNHCVNILKKIQQL